MASSHENVSSGHCWNQERRIILCRGLRKIQILVQLIPAIFIKNIEEHKEQDIINLYVGISS